MRILLTTTSYQDNPGEHHALLESTGAEIVRERGPLSEDKMLKLAGEFDALLCGDDAITRAVVEKSLPRLKVISKYGIGVDKIDVAAATEQGIPVSFCPGVNHTTVAEHTFALMLALSRHLVDEANLTRAGEWKRLTGNELMQKRIGIVGLGRIGREVAKRAAAFGMEITGFDPYWPEAFAAQYNVEHADGLTQLFRTCDVISLHTNLTEETRDVVCAASIANMRDGVLILNCARGELVNTADMAAALQSGKIGGYGTDVLDEEPPKKDHPLLKSPRCIVTPHIGSRTFESVQRQAKMATQNLINLLKGEKPLAQVNDVPPPSPLL